MSSSAAARLGKPTVAAVIPRGTEHLGQQLQRQADHVRLAPLEHVDPAEPVLVAEGAGLSFPLPAGQIFLQLLGERGSMRSVVAATRTCGRPCGTSTGKGRSTPGASGRSACGASAGRLPGRPACPESGPRTPPPCRSRESTLGTCRRRRRPSGRPGGRPIRPVSPRGQSAFGRLRRRDGPRTGSPPRAASSRRRGDRLARISWAQRYPT